VKKNEFHKNDRYRTDKVYKHVVKSTGPCENKSLYGATYYPKKSKIEKIDREHILLD
jgi:hypothetical protein